MGGGMNGGMQGAKRGMGGGTDGGSWGSGGGVKKAKVRPGNPDNPENKKGDPERTVWVGGIPEAVTPELIEESFKAAGVVVHFKMMGTTKVQPGVVLSKNNQGFKSAKVQYATKAEAQLAIAMFNGSEMDGAAIAVDPWVRCKS